MRSKQTVRAEALPVTAILEIRRVSPRGAKGARFGSCFGSRFGMVLEVVLVSFWELFLSRFGSRFGVVLGAVLEMFWFGLRGVWVSFLNRFGSLLGWSARRLVAFGSL